MPLTSRVIMKLLGVPPTDIKAFQDYSTIFLSTDPADQARYYSRGFPVCDRAAAQRDVLFAGCGYTVSPPSAGGSLPASGCG